MEATRASERTLANMILSHSDTSFQFRRQLLTATLSVLAAISILVPSDSWLERLVAPLKVILIGALSYGAVFIILEFIGSFMHRFAKFYALFCYYGGIIGLILSPLFMALDPESFGSSPVDFGSAEYFALILPQMAAGVFGAAASFNWLRSNDVA